MNSDAIERIDRQILHCLHIDGRAPFSRIAKVVGISEQTVARRYRRLRADGVVRVVGLVDPVRLGQTDWLIRVQCRPNASSRLAAALAQRDDVGWVRMTAGGSEVTGVVRAHTTEERDELLLSRLPNTSQVLGLSVHAILHRYLGSYAEDWPGYGDPLTAEQAAALQVPIDPTGEPVLLAADDQPMLDVLARDGRASYATLAAATGWSDARAARRLAALRASGTLYLDVDLAAPLLGFHSSAYLWLVVEPAQLATAGQAIAEHAEVPFAAAVSGPSNLVVSVISPNIEGLYDYVTTRIAAVAGVRQLEVSPVLRSIKQAGSLMAGDRLADPPPPARR